MCDNGRVVGRKRVDGTFRETIGERERERARMSDEKIYRRIYNQDNFSEKNMYAEKALSVQYCLPVPSDLNIDKILLNREAC